MSINAATHQYSECELAKIKFFLCPATHDGPAFPVSKALAVVTSNMLNRHWLDQLDLSEWTLFKESHLPNVPVDVDKVSVLSNENVPLAHAVLYYCWGDNAINQPYAMDCTIWIYMAAPTSKEKDDSKAIALSVF